MPVCDFPFRLRRSIYQTALLAGTSALALALAAPTAQARPLNGGAVVSPVTSAVATATAGSQQAAAIAEQAQSALSRAAQAVQAVQALQAAARTAAQASASSAPNGLTAGGLVVDPRVTAGTDANLWQNISLPTQTTSNGQTTVTLTQTSQRAIATWEQFNVGKNTTVDFDQSGGNTTNGNSWVVLNRIDATGNPSQILGQIKADGTVLIINPNGIVFTGTSQINVHTLIAVAGDINSYGGNATNVGVFNSAGGYTQIGTTAGGAAVLAPADEDNGDTQFIDSGLFANGVSSSGGTLVLSASSAAGANVGVQVDAGAAISTVTGVSGFDNGGFVLLAGPQVSNAGSIATSAGQIILAAANTVYVTEPATGSTATSFTVLNPTLATLGQSNPQALVFNAPAVVGGSVVENDVSGLLSSTRGAITLLGEEVQQLGVAEATTSITRAGSITITTTGATTFGPDSLTAILPDENGETIPSDATSLAAFAAPSIAIATTNMDMQSGSLILAPGATMNVTSALGATLSSPAGRVLLESGSEIDLAGTIATRSVADYLYTFKVTANDVADTPLAQSLIGQTVTIDLALSGTRSDGESWVGSPLFASSGAGYLSNITQGIDQLLTKGGKLTIGTFADVLSAKGSTVDVSGGYVQFTGATIDTTRLAGSNGAVYDIGSADPFITYAGLAGELTVDHAHWDITQTWTDPLIAHGYYQAGYIDGVSAGGVSVTAVNPVLEGDLVGDIVIGAEQRLLAQAATGTNGAQATPDQLPTGAALAINIAALPTGGAPISDDVVLASAAPDILGADFALGSTLALPAAAGSSGVLVYSTSALSASDFGSISVKGADQLWMTDGASLSVLPGGSITLTGVSGIDGTLTAHAGKITLTGNTPGKLAGAPPTAAVTIGPDAVLDVSGLWVNDAGLSGDALQGAAYINGGSVSISTTSESTYQTVGTLNYGNELVANVTDATQSIVLAAGSVIDLESGGYVSTAGKLKTGSDGLPAGNGGSLSLTLYNGTFAGYSSYDAALGGYVFGADPSQSTTYEALAPTPPNGLTAAVAFDGTIYAAGLNKGGTFTLQASSITIDGAATAIASAAGAITLPTAFFTSGFSTYNLTSIYGGVDLTAGTTLRLKQQNYLLSAGAMLPASGAELRDFASLGYAADGLRQPVSLSLSQGSPGDGVVDVATAGIVIPQGAAIVADPQADIALNAIGAITVEGSIVAPAGAIAFNQSSSFTAAGLDIWIGADAVLDVDGVYVANPLVAAYATGSVLDAGSITLGGAGPIIALAGAQFDLAGASATIEQPTGGLAGGRFAAQQIWSDGGTLTFTGNSLYFGGTIDAAGGAPLASGGTLNLGTVVTISSGTAVDAYDDIVIAESGNMAAAFAGKAAPATQSGLTALTAGVTGATAFITADTLNNSGLDSVSLTGPIAFSGNVAVSLPDALYLNGAITLLAAGVTPTSPASASTPTASGVATIGATQVTLSAGYIRFLNAAKVTPTLADGTLTLDASAEIDLAGVPVVSNAAQVNLISGGDISFLNNDDPAVSAYLYGWGYAASSGTTLTSSGYGGMPTAGALLVPDNLTLTAREIYPATDTAFLLMSSGLDPRASTPTASVNTITFKSNGATPYAPLSAGGAILVDAPNIVQGGALYAPLGTIQLGYGQNQTLPAIFLGSAADASGNAYDPVGDVYLGLFGKSKAGVSTVATLNVTLAPGSLTSVSAAGLDIPYGTTVDGANWSDGGLVLNGPPAKLIVLGGASIVTQAGATIDASGGGDVYATEFVAGTGGSRNVLTTANTYALVPSYEAKVAAYDPTSGETVALGSAVTLSGGDGIAAGTYTLLPASYATLPGAYRVVVVSTNTGANVAVSTVAADGSIYLSGTLTNAVTGAKSSSTALFEIQSDATWTKYSEIDINYGDAYFAKLAATNDTATARLASDAGQLVVAAANTLVLDATNQFAPASGGRGGEVDITGTNIVVAASDQLSNFGTVSSSGFTASSAYAGYLILDADQISDLGAESVLIGGARSQTSAGALITATALNLEVDSDAAHPLTGPDLLLVTLAPTVANAADRGLTVDAGSAIAAKGTVSSSSTDALIFGVDPAAQYQTVAGVTTLTGYSAGVSGDGALLRVSNGGVAPITRHFVPGVYTPPATTPTATAPASKTALGSLSVGSGVTLSGNALTFDSSGATTIAANAALSAKNFDLAANIVNLGGGSGGLVLSPSLIASFAGADTVSLRSASVFNLYGDSSFGAAANPIGTLTFDGAGFYSDGGTATIAATNVAFVDSQATANSSGANLTGSDGGLIVSASGVVTFGAGAKTLSGFAQASFAAGRQVLFTGSGSFDAKAANVTLAAPAIVADKGAVQSLTTTGVLDLAAAAGQAPTLAASDIGGALTLTAGSINVATALTAQAGNLTLEAKTGDLTLASTASLEARGTEVILFDIAEDTPGGTIKLISDTGNVTLASGSTVDVSAAGVGYAGTIAISAAKGRATLDDALAGAAAANDLGGNFTLVANTLAGSLPLSGFTGSFEVALGTGDIAIASGQTLTSANVLLEADGGSVNVYGAIDASGVAGGTIALFGAKGVDVEGSVLARASSATELGGTVEIGTSGAPNSTTTSDPYGAYNSAYGYENVAAANSGTITIGANAVIDVSGGVSEGLSGGTILIRAPLLEDGSVNVDISPTAKFVGSRATNLEAYAVWSTTDGTSGAQHFDGIVDPAGWYTNSGALEAGSFVATTNVIAATGATTTTTTPIATWDGANLTFSASTITTTASDTIVGNTYKTATTYAWNSSASTLTVTVVSNGYTGSSTTTTTYAGTAAVLAYLLSSSDYSPNSPNADHTGFYAYSNSTKQTPGTLMGFVETPGFKTVANAAGIANFAEVAGVDLDNPSAGVNSNSGNITVATNWNLGAENSSGALVYRTSATGQAPILTMKAVNDVDIDASITDGFAESVAVGYLTTVSGNTYGLSSTKYSAEYWYATYTTTTYANYITALLASATVVNLAAAEQLTTTQLQADLTMAAPVVYSSLSSSYTSSSLDYYYYLYAGGTTAQTAGAIDSYRIVYNRYLSTALYGNLNYFKVGGITLAGTTVANTSSSAYNYAQNAISYLAQATAAWNKISSSNSTAANLSYYGQYLTYYYSYITQYDSWTGLKATAATYGIGELPVTLNAFPTALLTAVPAGSVLNASTDNSPSPTATVTNQSPIASMDLAAETASTSYRIVAGALFDSANPLAVSGGGAGDVVVSGHISYVDPEDFGDTVSVGTMVRTGVGSIDIAAAGSFELADATAPGAVYTAGAATTTADFTAPTLTSIYLSEPNGLISAPSWGTEGGSVSIAVGGNIVGGETPANDGVNNWSSWYFHVTKSNGQSSASFSSAGDVQTAAWVNYATYSDGVGALGGGDVTLTAGGAIKSLIVSLPETIAVSGGTSNADATAVEHIYGGGDLLAQAGGNLLGGAFLVGDGAGTIRIGGAVTQDSSGDSLELGVQNSFVAVTANGALTLYETYDPAQLTLPAAAVWASDANNHSGAFPDTTITGNSIFDARFTSFNAESGVSLESVSGNVTILQGTSSELQPATLEVDAVSGGIQLDAPLELIPSSNGTLSLLAGGSISILGDGNSITMLDGTAAVTNALATQPPAVLSAALHADDDTPVYIYAGEDITGAFSLIKSAKIEAGRDIVDLLFTGENLHSTDVTSIIAGRDIIANSTSDIYGNVNSGDVNLTLYGPGDFLVEAGRNLGPFTTAASGGGIFAVGDGSNSGGTVIPYLPIAGANITALFGVGDGVDYAAAISDYVDPANAGTNGIDYRPDVAQQLDQQINQQLTQLYTEAATNTVSQLQLNQLNSELLAAGLSPIKVSDLATLNALASAARMGPLTSAQLNLLGQINSDLTASDVAALTPAQLGNFSSFTGANLTFAQAWATFEALPTVRQDLLVERAFLDFLTQVSEDYNNPASAYHDKYARAYDAIATLFPASYGYTDNNTSGANGASATVHTGDLRMAHSLIETQTGGDINILGPGGNAYVGSNASDNLTPAQQGILTLQGGSIRTYTDGSVEIYQSRIFTEQGGDVDMFSANGDLNAGKGKKSSAAYPPLQLVCDIDGYCRVSPAGLVTGAGIGALLSVPGQDPKKSNVVLTAPHGTVDAGAAGIRVAGNLNIVALQVLNAFNIQVGGTAVGVPVAPTADVGALTTAGAAAGAAAKSAEAPTQSQSADQPSIIMVEILGFGGGDGTPPAQPQTDDRSKKGDRRSQNDGAYDPYSPVHLLGNGALTDWQKRKLTADEKSNLENLAKPSAPL